MCSELTPRAHIPDNRIPQLMQPCPPHPWIASIPFAAIGSKQTTTYGTKKGYFFCQWLCWPKHDLLLLLLLPLLLGDGNKLGDGIQHHHLPPRRVDVLQCLILIEGEKNNAVFVIHPFYSKRLNRFVPSLWLVNDLIQPSQADPCLILILLWLCWFKRISFIEDNMKYHCI